MKSNLESAELTARLLDFWQEDIIYLGCRQYLAI